MKTKTQLTSIPNMVESRMKAESVLEDKIRRKESELNALQILQRVIPWDDICGEDEAKLWSYFCRSDT